MSSDELSYALYLLNAPAPLPPTAEVAVANAGTEEHAGKVDGGKATVRTGVDFNAGATAYPGGFSVGYEGGVAGDTGWIQFLWSEVVATQADGKENHVAQGGLPTTNGVMELTTDPTSPSIVVDSASADSPFYEAGGVDIRTPSSTTLYDRPSEFSDILTKQFDAGATKGRRARPFRPVPRARLHVDLPHVGDGRMDLHVEDHEHPQDHLGRRREHQGDARAVPQGARQVLSEGVVHPVRRARC